MKDHTTARRTSEKAQHSQDTPKTRAQCCNKTHWTQTSKTQRSQQQKTSMANRRSLKRALLQAEIQENSEKQVFTHSCSKKNGKVIPKARRSVNMRNRISNIHESTRRFNVSSPKNAKEHYR
jgi:hypothetical protein